MLACNLGKKLILADFLGFKLADFSLFFWLENQLSSACNIG